MNESLIFAEALKRPTPVERKAYLDGACGDDPTLRKRVEELLCASDRDDSFLEKPAGNLAATIDNPAGDGIDPSTLPEIEDASGTRIGPYKLLQKIGEGGMGTVWMAEQQEPVRRMVAVKLVKSSMDSTKIVARFEAERQALALMDHPNIARIYDAGIVGRRPYFVMELVKGTPITQYCDEHRLPPKQRLELFVFVCQAIQHAHQKGIIHRDIKPSNVLVAPYDGRPVVKVIDFGVAKATGQRLTDKTMYTEFGAIVGTLEYMSPEQAELNNQDIDTRSDIYGLGVLLYELLTGSTPLNRKSMKQQAMLEMLRLVREEEPPKPSTRLSSDAALPSISAQRRTDPAKLTQLLKGELDWIVMKSLEKDRARRYETANGLARDLERYLADEVVEARPLSTGYRLRKFIKRNKVQVVAAILIVLAVAGGAGVATWQAIRATAAKAEADRSAEEARAAAIQEAEARKAADVQRLAAENARKIADDMAAQSIAVSEFLQFDLLRQANPINQANRNFAPDRDLTLRVAVDRAAEKIGEKFKDRPNVEGAIRQAIGETYRGLGELDKALVQFRRASEITHSLYGPRDPVTLTIDFFLGSTLQDARRFKEALPIIERTRTASEAVRGEDHQDTLILDNQLALLYKQLGDVGRAIPLYEKTLRANEKLLGPNHEFTLTCANNLAGAYQEVGRFAESESLAVRVLDGRRTILGEQHPLTDQARSNLAGTYNATKKYGLARPLLVQSLAANLKNFGPIHSDTLITRLNLAHTLIGLRQFEEAVIQLEAILATKSLPDDHPIKNTASVYLAQARSAMGRPDLAVPLLRVAVARARKVYLTQSEPTASYIKELAFALDQLGQFDQSEPLFRELIETTRITAGKESRAYANDLAFLGRNLLGQQKWAEAESVLAESIAIQGRLAPDGWFQFYSRGLQGSAFLGQKKYAEAEPLLLAGYEGMKQREKAIPSQFLTRIPEAIDRLIEFNTALNKPEEVKKWKAERAKYPATPTAKK